MGQQFRFRIADQATPVLRKYLDMVKGPNRVRLHRMIGSDLAYLVRSYFHGLQETRHKTAEALGAKVTNYWAKAEEGVSYRGDMDAAHVGIAAPGIGRAVHDVDIFPSGGREYLTIPIASEAYGHRILQGEEPRFSGGFFFTSKKGNLIYARKEGEGASAQIHPLYLLKPSVHQEQDRTLLPSDEAIETTIQTTLKRAFTDDLRDQLRKTEAQIRELGG